MLTQNMIFSKVYIYIYYLHVKEGKQISPNSRFDLLKYADPDYNIFKSPICIYICCVTSTVVRRGQLTGNSHGSKKYNG